MAEVTGVQQTLQNAKRAVYAGVDAVIDVNRKKAREVFDKSQSLVDVDTGHLRSTGKVTDTKTGATIQYTARYAAKLEFSTKIKRKNGQPFFLHQPMTESVQSTGAEWQGAFLNALQANSQGG